MAGAEGNSCGVSSGLAPASSHGAGSLVEPRGEASEEAAVKTEPVAEERIVAKPGEDKAAEELAPAMAKRQKPVVKDAKAKKKDKKAKKRAKKAVKKAASKEGSTKKAKKAKKAPNPESSSSSGSGSSSSSSDSSDSS